MDRPLISVVIANYNYGRFLEEAIMSVLSQGMGNQVEIIICDGGSTDNSVDIIKKYARGLPRDTYYSEWNRANCEDYTVISWWCSEKDGGQSEAFNKGFAKARGEWLTWLNADDIFLGGALKALERKIRANADCEWITGNMLSFNSDTRMIRAITWGPHACVPLLRGSHVFNIVFGPTTFFKKNLYDRIGKIDEKLHYAMDTEYWIRLIMSGIKQVRLNKLCWALRVHEESKTQGEQDAVITRRRQYEAEYIYNKTRYQFRRSIFNFWYIVWVLWRVVDGSWIMRKYLKLRYEGCSINVLR